MTEAHFLKQPRFYLLAAAALVWGGVIGASTAGFWVVVYAGIDFMWETVPAALGLETGIWWYTLTVCIVGGALVGLCQRFLGDYPKDIKHELQEFRAHGRFDTAHILQGMVTSFVSLAAGASLGPEAPLFALGGGLSSIATEQLKRISASTPAVTPSVWTKASTRLLLIVALLGGAFAFVRVAVAGGVLGAGGIFDPSLYTFAWDHVLWAVPAGLIGVLAGYLFLYAYERVRRLSLPFQGMPFRRALLGGVILGLIAAAFPLTLFSGQHSLLELQMHGAEGAGLTLLMSGLLKILAVCVLLNAGWKGGTFLPLMTGAAMLGLLVNVLFSSAPVLVLMVSAMAAIAVITLDNVVVVLILMLLLAPLNAVAASITGVVIGAVTLRLQKYVIQSRSSGAPTESLGARPGTD